MDKNNEYINREAAIKEVYRFDNYLDDDLEWRLHYALKKLPAADVVEAKHAYKIDITATKDFFSWYKCSACGYSGLFLEDKYCSCCGARLDGGQEDV